MPVLANHAFISRTAAIWLYYGVLYDRGLTVSLASARPSQRTQCLSYKNKPYPISLTPSAAGRPIEGDSGEKAYIFGGDRICHGEKNVHMNMCLMLNG